MKVLSLFDGMACGYEALLRAGIKVEKYYASEIDKYAMQIAMKNHPDIIQIGDVCNVKGEDYQDIDLLIGGSPCQGFSFAGKQLNFEDPRSKLFFEYVRLLRETKPKYFLLENVKMKKEYEEVINKELWGITPTLIDSSLLSAQSRKRLYRVGVRQDDGTYKKVEIPQPEDKGIYLKDIIEENVDEKYYFSKERWDRIVNGKYDIVKRLEDIEGKCATITTVGGGNHEKKIFVEGSAVRNQVVKGQIETKLNVRKDGKSNCVVGSYGDKLNQVAIIQKVGDRDKNNWGIHTDKSYCLPANPMSDRGQIVLIAYAPGSREFEQQGWKQDKSPTICARDYKDPKVIYLPCGTQYTSSQNFGNSFGSQKGYTLRASTPNGVIEKVGIVRKLTPTECEKLQTMEVGYTEGVSDSQRYKMLGNGWTCDVIVHIFRNLLK